MVRCFLFLHWLSASSFYNNIQTPVTVITVVFVVAKQIFVLDKKAGGAAAVLRQSYIPGERAVLDYGKRVREIKIPGFMLSNFSNLVNGKLVIVHHTGLLFYC